jgi:hypothetical protein
MNSLYRHLFRLSSVFLFWRALQCQVSCHERAWHDLIDVDLLIAARWTACHDYYYVALEILDALFSAIVRLQSIECVQPLCVCSQVVDCESEVQLPEPPVRELYRH